MPRTEPSFRHGLAGSSHVDLSLKSPSGTPFRDDGGVWFPSSETVQVFPVMPVQRARTRVRFADRAQALRSW